jgi:uncharacterized tellurite resistance protein B-like protein
MLDRLRQFITDVVSPAAAEQAFDDNGYRLAATALFVHVISLDGEPTAAEKRKLHALLQSRFGLAPGAADKLIASATLAEGEAVDLYHFTSVIMPTVALPSSRRTSCGAPPTCSRYRRRIGLS